MMTRFTSHILGGSSAIVLAAALAVPAYAQEISSAMRGQVVDDAGQAIAGVSLVIRHDPTGTTTRTTSGDNGFYSVSGLRPGGPYTVTATRDGTVAATLQVGNIGIGDPAQVDVVIGATQLTEITVSGDRIIAGNVSGGPSSDFSEAQIQSLPSISRDLKDVARLDPFASIQDPDNEDALSFAGANTRFNQLTVDGIRQNDDFGLNNNGYPTQRSPISIDAVEAVQVSVAPYSVINNGFLGGSINAVTKSGSNTLEGTAFYEFTSDSISGDKIRGVKTGRKFEEKTWGATLGGPIIKDKLFFFASYEKFNATFNLDDGPADSGKINIIPRITTGAIATFTQAVQSRYNYDAGSWVDDAPPVSDEKILGKLDWNITDSHRLAATYQRTRGSSFNGTTSSAFAGGNQVSRPRVGLESGQYFKDERLDQYTVKLNSDWSDIFSTEMRLGHKTTETTQLPFGGLEVGQVTVRVADLPGVLPGSGTPEIQFGADTFRHDNYLKVKTKNAELIGRLTLGDHNLMGGMRLEKQDINNVFVAFSLGNWTFNSYADFLAGRVGSFSLTGAVDPAGGTVPATFGTARNGAAEFKYDLYSAYLEDSWQVSSDLTVNYGLRYDWFAMTDAPVLNANFVTRTGFSNRQNLAGLSALLPRFSFKYDGVEDVRISGGLGKFSSQGLNVWISNPFANDGVRQTNAAGCNLTVPVTSLRTPPAGCTFTPGNGSTNVLDPDLKMPTVWKASLSLAYDFDLGAVGNNWTASLDLLGLEYRDSLHWFDLRAVRTGTAPDGRPIYARGTTGVTGASRFDLMLTNLDNGGQSRSVSAGLSKYWDEGFADGLSLSGRYTYTRAKDKNPLTSSIGLSSYTRYAYTDAQNPVAATSDYEIRHRFTLNVNWEKELFGDNKSAITIFAQRRSGTPFSYTFANSRANDVDNDFGNITTSYSGQQASSSHLFYVPQGAAAGNVTATSDPIVQYAPGFDFAGFNAFLTESGLGRYEGGNTERNAFRSKSVTTIDIRLSQELPAFFPNGAKLKLYMDLENFGNLLNSKWGVLEQYTFYRGVPVADMRIVGNKFEYSNFRKINPFVVTRASLWQIKVGARYAF